MARLGWLGPAIVGVGLAGGSVGIWYMIHAKPKTGPVIDRFPLDDRGAELVVYAEDGGERAFVEARDKTDVKWQALVPPYEGGTGRPAIAWSDKAVSVRVVRDGRSEVFALAMADGRKLGGFKLAPNHERIDEHAHGPLTVTDHVRSYEIVYGPDWHQLVGIDLNSGRGLWRVELGAGAVTDFGVTGGIVSVEIGGKKRQFQVFNGEPIHRFGEPPANADQNGQ